MTWMAGLPGEALAPGVPGPDVNNFPLKKNETCEGGGPTNSCANSFVLFFQVPGGAAKLSDIAKVGHYFFLWRENMEFFFLGI